MQKLLLISTSVLGLLLLPSCVVTTAPVHRTYAHTNVGYLRALPYGYQTVYISGRPYYRHGNSWYQRHTNGYVKCAQPTGYHSNHKVAKIHHNTHSSQIKYRSTYVNGRQYFVGPNNQYHVRKGNHYTKVSSPNTYKKHHSKTDPKSYTTNKVKPTSPASKPKSKKTSDNRHTTQKKPKEKVTYNPRSAEAKAELINEQRAQAQKSSRLARVN